MIKIEIDLNAPRETWKIPKIDPTSISQSACDGFCRIFHDYIKKMMADPVKRAEYESWKAEHEKQKAERGE